MKKKYITPCVAKHTLCNAPFLLMSTRTKVHVKHEVGGTDFIGGGYYQGFDGSDMQTAGHDNNDMWDDNLKWE